MSAAWARASPVMIGPSTSRAIVRTASKSPGEAAGKPASITSTPRRASWCAISSFSPGLSEMPGDCSPSRRVVSKMMTRSFMAFLSGLSGFENLVFFARMHGQRRRVARVRADELLDAVGLSEAARRPVHTYSHGMQKRLSFARALLHLPAVLLVDEATHDLDPAA